MSVKRLVFLGLAAMVVVFLAGCGSDEPSSPEEEEIQDLINGEYSAYFSFSDVFYADDELLKAETPEVFDSLYNWRYTDRDISRDINITVDGDTADVEVQHTLSATAVFQGWIAGTLATYERPVEFSGTRYATFVKEDGVWVLKEISLVNVKTDLHISLIDSVVVINHTTGDRYVVSVPGALIPVEDIFTFTSGDSIEVNVYTSEDCFVQYRHPNFASYRRDGMEEGETHRHHHYCAPVHSVHGVKRLVVDAITQESALNMDEDHTGEIWVILAQVNED